MVQTGATHSGPKGYMARLARCYWLLVRPDSITAARVSSTHVWSPMQAIKDALVILPCASDDPLAMVPARSILV
ncbi:hypothetical protein HBI56_115920 [Parastagonospora nodorum]|uniref:Uncharacterized protein n=1 Tax=Phaeosphaeria nodorum (strain SN15 / ATCC MYA-4574 / FGSC 10173) TaxID=321614 RepID=A0A7U2I605_PHANO|nr:hypothetical protein HBH56_238680 [Parastagonospora nodorum]QRD00648.1 hypothetical protein JI435_415560 [Parastagonospora nodorum SN15]KAH3925860.1 hypothetical protein HBH54_177470 [Parastagonospora nodorum]KAH3952924.1 hypothetical protein HBH53_038840 [Parastagonospora nodorum]KAH3976517.1 hypothetical protein HBH52_119810 [Parastagonospora nodorum]